jgi:hexokinase
MTISIKNLRETVASYTRYQLESGSTHFYMEQGRNGYQVVDLYRIKADGSYSCESMLECGTSRECIAAIQLHHAQKAGYIFPQTAGTLTRAQALSAIKLSGLDLSADFFELDSWDVELLVTWAKLTRYRKPRHANGSLGRYFFAHLQKLDKQRG